jgi:putative FmdB family regulatory protein
MPTYEFRCPEGHEFERFFRKVSDAPREVECPECGKIAGRILSAGAGLLFKGSGFYLTDYGKNAHRKGGSGGGEGKKGDGGSSGGGASGGGSTGGSSGGSSGGGSSSGGSSGGSTGSSSGGTGSSGSGT